MLELCGIPVRRPVLAPCCRASVALLRVCLAAALVRVSACASPPRVSRSAVRASCLRSAAPLAPHSLAYVVLHHAPAPPSSPRRRAAQLHLRR
uniref:Uncharacterized protein n=1 Tax=Oryza sativa subsp. japonica TaxID=39947 RepID=Q6ZCQ7_ORYSJ|nr:hypothetical protein [Oryza sativa Japonica Group]